MARPAELVLIAAVARNRVIGLDNKMPWHLPEDLRYFKAQTEGHTVLMGRKTFESLGRPLPKRRNIVITRQSDWQAEGVEVAHSLHEAYAACAPEGRVFVIGGAELYRQALPEADTLLLTEMDITPEGDTFFPEFDAAQFREAARDPHQSAQGMHYAFVRYSRQQPE